MSNTMAGLADLLGKDTVVGRIQHIQRIDAERVLVQLTDDQRVHLFVNEENEKKLHDGLLETATFIGKTKLGVLEATVVIFNKAEKHLSC